jgi:hypothetical protein
MDVIRVCLSLQQSRMEERLDDAIHVLRHHAEAGELMPGVPGVPGMPPGMVPTPSQHSNGLAGINSGFPPGMAPMHAPYQDSQQMVSADT